MDLLILGNGFDLAHGRKTTYADFLEYTKQGMYGKRAESDGLKQEMIDEMNACLDNNVWHKYFKHIHSKGMIRGKNWIDFEREIKDVIEVFDFNISDLYEPFNMVLQKIEVDRKNRKANEFINKLIYKSGTNKDLGWESGEKNCGDFIDKTYDDLEKLIRCLEIYLDGYIARIPITCYSPDIENISCNAVLTFNYTSIPQDLYHNLGTIQHIHGIADCNRKAEDNDMVLGVNEYWDEPEKNIHTNFNLYKKFVQRIMKKSGLDYHKNIVKPMNTFSDTSKECAFINNIYIFGHSLDVTDGDILKEIIEMPCSITTIFYRNKRQQANQIANLSKILGQETMINYIIKDSPKIIFKKQADMEEIKDSK